MDRIMPISEALRMDCMYFMRELPDKYFDLAVVDPPYGIGMDSGLCSVHSNSLKGKTFARNQRRFPNKSWDREKPCGEYFHELFRVSNNQIIWGGNYFTAELSETNAWIFWHKKITNSTSPGFSDGELAWTSFVKPVKYVAVDWIGFGYINNRQEDRKVHPTPKPVKLYDWIFKNYAKPGYKILDTHLGSGSSRISAHKAGLDFWATEIDKDYFEEQEKRFNQYLAQLTLEFAQ